MGVQANLPAHGQWSRPDWGNETPCNQSGSHATTHQASGVTTSCKNGMELAQPGKVVVGDGLMRSIGALTAHDEPVAVDEEWHPLTNVSITNTQPK